VAAIASSSRTKALWVEVMRLSNRPITYRPKNPDGRASCSARKCFAVN
jgi:hypothetical protein